MNISKINGTFIEAISAAVPKKTIKNTEFAKESFPKDDFEKTINALGIEQRHVIDNPQTTALDLCFEAARNIFVNTRINPEEIGAVIFVTLTPDNLMPNNASLIQHLLGLQSNIAAFDLNHACSGYIYGLWIASLMVKNMNTKVLLLDGDVNTKYISPWDKATAFLFGDAGTATVISPSNSSESHFSFVTDGSKRDSLIIPGMGFRRNLTQEDLQYQIYEDGSRRRMVDLFMKGEEVFSYVVNTVPKIANEFLDELEIIVDEVEYLILHQANAFMLRKLSRKLNFTPEKVPFSIQKFGNTSSASIPLNICSELKIAIKQPKRCILIGMGAGLSTGIADITIGPTICLGVKEVDL